MVAEAEVFDQVGHGAGGRGLPVPQGAVLTLLGQALPDAGVRLLNLKRAFPVQVSPSVIFWFRNDKEKTGFEKASMPALDLHNQEPILDRILEAGRPFKTIRSNLTLWMRNRGSEWGCESHGVE